MTALPADLGGAAMLVTVDLTRTERRTAVPVARDGDELLALLAEGSPAHHDLIYDPNGSLEFPAVRVSGEIEMTTAEAADLAAQLGAPAGDWLVVRLVPTAVTPR